MGASSSQAQRFARNDAPVALQASVLQAPVAAAPAAAFQAPAEAVKQNGFALQYASEGLQNNKQVVLEAVKQNGFALQYASEGLQNNKQVVLEALRETAHSLHYASRELKNDSDLILEAIKQGGWALQYASRALKNNPEIVSEAVKKDGVALQYASEDLKMDAAFVLEAVTQNQNVLLYASPILNTNPNFIKGLLKIKNLTTYHIFKKECDQAKLLEGLTEEDTLNKILEDKTLMKYADRKVGLAAITQHGYLLKYASEKLKNDKQVVLEAVQKNGCNLRHASAKLNDDPTFIEALVNIKDLPEQHPFKMKLESLYAIKIQALFRGKLARNQVKFIKNKDELQRITPSHFVDQTLGKKGENGENGENLINLNKNVVRIGALSVEDWIDGHTYGLGLKQPLSQRQLEDIKNKFIEIKEGRTAHAVKLQRIYKAISTEAPFLKNFVTTSFIADYIEGISVTSCEHYPGNYGLANAVCREPDKVFRYIRNRCDLKITEEDILDAMAHCILYELAVNSEVLIATQEQEYQEFITTRTIGLQDLFEKVKETLTKELNDDPYMKSEKTIGLQDCCEKLRHATYYHRLDQQKWEELKRKLKIYGVEVEPVNSGRSLTSQTKDGYYYLIVPSRVETRQVNWPLYAIKNRSKEKELLGPIGAKRLTRTVEITDEGKKYKFIIPVLRDRNPETSELSQDELATLVQGLGNRKSPGGTSDKNNGERATRKVFLLRECINQAHQNTGSLENTFFKSLENEEKYALELAIFLIRAKEVGDISPKSVKEYKRSLFELLDQLESDHTTVDMSAQIQLFMRLKLLEKRFQEDCEVNANLNYKNYEDQFTQVNPKSSDSNHTLDLTKVLTEANQLNIAVQQLKSVSVTTDKVETVTTSLKKIKDTVLKELQGKKEEVKAFHKQMRSFTALQVGRETVAQVGLNTFMQRLFFRDDFQSFISNPENMKLLLQLSALDEDDFNSLEISSDFNQHDNWNSERTYTFMYNGIQSRINESGKKEPKLFGSFLANMLSMSSYFAVFVPQNNELFENIDTQKQKTQRGFEIHKTLGQCFNEVKKNFQVQNLSLKQDDSSENEEFSPSQWGNYKQRFTALSAVFLPDFYKTPFFDNHADHLAKFNSMEAVKEGFFNRHMIHFGLDTKHLIHILCESYDCMTKNEYKRVQDKGSVAMFEAIAKDLKISDQTREWMKQVIKSSVEPVTNKANNSSKIEMAVTESPSKLGIPFPEANNSLKIEMAVHVLNSLEF